jgi:hypothetical protein
VFSSISSVSYLETFLLFESNHSIDAPSVAVQAIENIIIIVQAYAQCHNHSDALWDPKVNPEEYCDPLTFQTVMAYLSSAINSLSDLVLTGLPAFVLMRLNMRLRTKIALIAVFALGLV